jgi:transcriptional regulator of heat shock response
MTLFLDKRRVAILKAVIESYIRTADPVASGKLLKEHDFLISSATMRNEMAFLEQLGLLKSLHTSSGRVPTDQGMRLFVDQLMDELANNKLDTMRVHRELEFVQTSDIERRVKDGVMNMSKVCGSVSFATMPWRGDYCCLGLSNLLKQQDHYFGGATTTIMEFLEDQDGFVDLLEKLDISSDISIVIGEENLKAEFHSCSLVVSKYEIGGKSGYIGILGPKRMDYARNIEVLKCIKGELAINN